MNNHELKIYKRKINRRFGLIAVIIFYLFLTLADLNFQKFPNGIDFLNGFALLVVIALVVAMMFLARFAWVDSKRTRQQWWNGL